MGQGALTALALFLVMLAAAVTHLPSLHGGILGWDDRRALEASTGWRGLGWANLRYDFTATDMAMYRPLTWLSYGLDYALRGMDAHGFHRTNLALHVLVAGLLLLVIRRWLLLLGRGRWFWPAVLATLAFTLHPVRVQVVAWISARADALCAVFLLAATVAWLHWLRHARPWARVLWHLLFVASLLSKPVALLAPLVWWLGHRYLSSRAAVRAPGRAALADGALGLVFAGAVTVPLLFAKSVVTNGGGVPELPASAAFAALHNAVFPLWKTLAPYPLGYYEPAYPFRPLELPYVVGAVAAMALAALVFQARRRAPGLVLVALAYLALLAPMLGIVPFGYELVADRFSYLPTLVWSIGLAALVGAQPERRARIIGGAAVAWLTVMACLSWRQCGIYRDDSTFWAHNHAHFPSSGMANAGMGDVMMTQSCFDEARRFYLRARELQPEYTGVMLGLGAIALVENRPEDAIAALEIYLRSRPDHRGAREDIMRAYQAAGRVREARAVAEMLRREDELRRRRE